MHGIPWWSGRFTAQDDEVAYRAYVAPHERTMTLVLCGVAVLTFFSSWWIIGVRADAPSWLFAATRLPMLAAAIIITLYKPRSYTARDMVLAAGILVYLTGIFSTTLFQNEPGHWLGSQTVAVILILCFFVPLPPPILLSLSAYAILAGVAVARVTLSVDGMTLMYKALPVVMVFGTGAAIQLSRNRRVAWLTIVELARERARAEELGRAKSNFLAMMSHEIRTPMNGVLGMVGLMLEAPLAAEQRDRAIMIRDSSKALLTVLDDVLDLTKLEAGHLNIAPKPFRPADLVVQVIELLRTRALEKGIGLIYDLATELPECMNGDSSRLRQVLLNLVGNAVKFTEQGSVSLTLSVVHYSSKNPYVRFEITDTGIGISDEAQKSLFQEFVQADSSISRRFGGTGLGLAISKRLVEDLMGGRIGVHSRPAKGSTFWFEIPLEPAHIADLPNDAIAPPPHPNRPLRILLAEDNVVNQKVALGLLQRHHQVIVVDNGTNALAEVESSTFDVVLMDMRMPEMDGLEATRAIRALSGNKGNVPIIAMTANSLDGDRERCLAVGMNDYVSKPIDPTALFAALARQTANGEVWSPPILMLTKLEETRAIFSDEEFRDLAESYVKQARLVPDAMRNGCTETMTDVVHNLKGNSEWFGLGSVSASAKSIELAIREGRIDEARALASELERHIEEGVVALTEFMPEVFNSAS